MKDGVHGDTGSCRKERGKFRMVFPQKPRGYYWIHWMPILQDIKERQTKGIGAVMRSLVIIQ